MIAYALYKEQKREFIMENGLSSEDERVRFYHSDLNQGRINSLRVQAQDKLQAYADKIIMQISEEERVRAQESQVVEVISAVVESRAEDIERIVKQSTVWWKTIVFGAISSFLFAVILTVFGFIAWTNPFEAMPHQVNTPSTPAAIEPS